MRVEPCLGGASFVGEADALVRRVVPPLWAEQLKPLQGSSLSLSYEPCNDPSVELRYVVACRILARWGASAEADQSDGFVMVPRWAGSLCVPLSSSERAGRASALDALPAATLGSLDPRVLFLGERTSGWQRWDGNFRRLPFVGLNHSSLFLYRLFKEAGVEECDIHLGNSLDEKGDVFPLDDFLAIFPSLETIVLLGKKAEEAVARAFPRTLKTVEVVKYPHPSFIKRFHYQEVNAWGKNLAQALGL